MEVSMATEVETQSGMGQTVIWLAAMLVGLAVIAYFML
jgi:hypothetical protein